MLKLFTGDRYFRTRLVFYSSDGSSLRSISMSRGPEVNVETKGYGVSADSRKVMGRTSEGKSRLFARISKSDPALLLLFLFGLVLLIGLSVSLCYPTQHASPPTKPKVRMCICGIALFDDKTWLWTMCIPFFDFVHYVVFSVEITQTLDSYRIMSCRISSTHFLANCHRRWQTQISCSPHGFIVWYWFYFLFYVDCIVSMLFCVL